MIGCRLCCTAGYRLPARPSALLRFLQRRRTLQIGGIDRPVDLSSATKVIAPPAGTACGVGSTKKAAGPVRSNPLTARPAGHH